MHTYALSTDSVRRFFTGVQPHGFSAYPSCGLMCLGAQEKPPESTGMRSGGVCENLSIRILWGFGDLNFWDSAFGKLFHPHPSASTTLLTEKKKVNVELGYVERLCSSTSRQNRFFMYVERVYILSLIFVQECSVRVSGVQPLVHSRLLWSVRSAQIPQGCSAGGSLKIDQFAF